jgi:hypothetical protein
MSDMRPLSEMQRSMMAHEILVHRPIYNMPLCFKILGEIDIERLSQALTAVVTRHTALNGLYDGRGSWEPNPDTPSLELARLNVHGSTATIPGELRCLWESNFDLGAERPIRYALASYSETEHWLGICIHHIAGDSWSIDMFLREVSALYRAPTEQLQKPPEAACAGDFFDFAIWERRAMVSSEWWETRLTQAHTQPPTKRAFPDEKSRGEIIMQPIAIGGVETKTVRRIASQYRVSTASILLTALGMTISEGSPEAQSLVGLPVALRDTELRQRTIGPLLNTLPVLTSWDSDGGPSAALEAHSASLAKAMEFAEVPYSRIMRSLKAKGATEADALLNHIMSVETQQPRLSLRGLQCTRVEVNSRWAIFPAVWDFTVPSVGNLRGLLSVSNEFYTSSAASALVQSFKNNLLRMA